MYADDIGRVGAVYSNGGDFTFERLQLRIAQGTPLVDCCWAPGQQ